MPIDLATARTNRPRHLAVVALVFAVSLLPFALTNYAITGNPVQPLRLLPDYKSQPLAGDSVGAASSSSVASSGASPSPPETTGSASDGPTGMAGTSTSSNPAGDTLSGLIAFVGSLAVFVGDAVATVVGGLAYFQSRLTHSFHVITDVERLADVFFGSGYRPLRTGQDRAVNLSVLESMPLFGVVLTLPLVAVWRRRRLLTDGGSVRARLSDSTRWSRPSLRFLSATQSTDVFVALYAAILVVFYLRSLPLHHMLTVRYLHPLYPVGVYALVRTPAVRRVIRQEWSTLWRAYTVAVAGGVPLYLGALVLFDTVQSEAIQLYALVALLVGVAVDLWSVSSALVGND
ncbi:hypothetical protein SAMN04487950_2331 [Halogranum rubrum]|uniref:Uncharacterized protein n=1 Tax=Halogranum rubrum TaxID=553466 RepID=A0A1I4ETW0_9EURY|nr:hypothetical protein [Halogranum rubrum]SFL07977.1 hypothetical protein SAMN04487950_2331 [Halogranum rubrum]